MLKQHTESMWGITKKEQMENESIEAILQKPRRATCHSLVAVLHKDIDKWLLRQLKNLSFRYLSSFWGVSSFLQSSLPYFFLVQDNNKFSNNRSVPIAHSTVNHFLCRFHIK